MKIRVTMKDPDTLFDAIDDVLIDQKKMYMDMGLSEEAAEAAAGVDSEKMTKFASKFFEYGEYLTVELDDEAGTITVLEKD
jgi:hypothetical protein